jgi:hypothetical protein
MKTDVLACRLPSKEAAAVRALANLRGRSVSEELRDAALLVLAEARAATSCLTPGPRMD